MQATTYPQALRDRVIELYAQFTPTREIQAKIKMEFTVMISMQYIDGLVWRKNSLSRQKMLALRQGYCQDVMAHPAAQKMKRLEECWLIVQRFKNSTDEKEAKVALQALKQCQEEIEGNKVNAKYFLQFNQFNGKTDDELLGELDRIEAQLAASARVATTRIGSPENNEPAPILCPESDPVLLPHSS